MLVNEKSPYNKMFNSPYANFCISYDTQVEH